MTPPWEVTSEVLVWATLLPCHSYHGCCAASHPITFSVKWLVFHIRAASQRSVQARRHHGRVDSVSDHMKPAATMVELTQYMVELTQSPSIRSPPPPPWSSWLSLRAHPKDTKSGWTGCGSILRWSHPRLTDSASMLTTSNIWAYTRPVVDDWR